ncbi:MAG TPA: ABC transporter ATP-binding protein [Bacteroidales bacterium]|nr:ABC transporter ATP-binding protein [Bacteroidales bacterium]
MQRQTDPILQVKNLSKRFKEIKAVDDLSLEVMKGDIYGFLGPNGSGKSTTIRMMLSLLQPDKGRIEIFGLPLQQNRMRILKNVGAFIEKPDFYEYLSAFKNLELLSRYSGIVPDRIHIMEILDLVGLKDRAYSKVSTFSKGMKQRLGIAQSLLHEPELLILDEPASGLDPSGNRDIRELIRFLNTGKGKTIILSSHNLSEIELVANRMLIINKGQKVIEGGVRELLTAQSYRTTFMLDNGPKALESLKKSTIEYSDAVLKGDMLQLHCTREAVPDINAFLAGAGIRIETIKIEQNLEEFFLNMT